ncbi:MAG: hypothetical protein ACLPYS_01460 [Vulcanimicrobiaceae bacterium]
MLPPAAYEEARRTAPIHVQVRVSRLLGSPDASGCTVEGRLVRIFRDDSRLMRVGRGVRFNVPTHGKRDGPPLLDGTIYHSWERLTSSKFFEVFLCPSNGGVELVRSQLAPVRRPTRQAVCGPETQGFCCPGNLHEPSAGFQLATLLDDVVHAMRTVFRL